jgi:hypothetical protein
VIILPSLLTDNADAKSWIWACIQSEGILFIRITWSNGDAALSYKQVVVDPDNVWLEWSQWARLLQGTSFLIHNNFDETQGCTTAIIISIFWNKRSSFFLTNMTTIMLQIPLSHKYRHWGVSASGVVGRSYWCFSAVCFAVRVQSTRVFGIIDVEFAALILPR